MSIDWNKKTEEKFSRIIENLPQFHRSIAQRLIKEKSEELAKDRASKEVEDKDLFTAFFQEIPPAFKEMLKRLLTKLEIDYSEYVNQGKEDK